MITSQVVSLSDSMVLRFVLLEGDEEKRMKIAKRLCKFERGQRTLCLQVVQAPSRAGRWRWCRPHLGLSSSGSPKNLATSFFPLFNNHPPNQVQLPQHLYGQHFCELPFIRQLHVGRQTKPKLILYLLLLNHQRVKAGRTERDIFFLYFLGHQKCAVDAFCFLPSFFRLICVCKYISNIIIAKLSFSIVMSVNYYSL